MTDAAVAAEVAIEQHVASYDEGDWEARPFGPLAC